MDADLIVWYPPGEVNETVSNNKLHHDIDHTVFEGQEVTNWPRFTILRGEVAYDRDGAGLSEAKGEFVKRIRGSLGADVQRSSGNKETMLDRIARLGAARKA